MHLLCGLLLLPALAAIARCDNVDVISYDLDFKLEDERIQGLATLTAKAANAQRSLRLQLASSMKLNSCKLGERDVPFQRSGWNLELDLEAVGSPSGELQLTFELEGSPYNKQRSGMVRTIISPEHAYVRSQYAWYPRHEHDLAVHRTSFTARKDWLLRTAGELQEELETEEGRQWFYVENNPCLQVGFAAGPYVAIAGGGNGGVELNALVMPGHEVGAMTLLKVAADAIEVYGALCGSMEARRFSLVEMPASFGAASGYGEVGYALIGAAAFEQAENAPWAAGLIAHEVAHTWWGREVVFSNFANEMLATYSTLRYIEEKRGTRAALAERRKLSSRVAQVAAERGLINLGDIQGWSAADSTIYTACAYDKSAMLLHILERKMGRKVFDKTLKRFFEKQRGQVADYSDVRKALGGSKYKSLFAQWERATIPTLRTEYESSSAGSQCKVAGTVFQEGTPEPFAMALTLRAISGEQSFDLTLKLRKSETKFKFTCPFEPEEILLDPDRHLLLGRPAALDIGALTKAIFAVANSPKAGDPDQLTITIRNIRKVLAAGPDSESVYHTALGRCYFRLGDLEEARQEFETALQGGAGGPFHRSWVHLRLGCISELEGDRSAAEEHYAKVQSSPDARNIEYQKSLAKRFTEKPYRGYQQDG